MKEYYESLENLIGYGDPANAKYFFFALEENWDMTEQENAERKNYYIECNRKKRRNFFAIDCNDLYKKHPDLIANDLKGSKKSILYRSYLNIYNLLNEPGNKLKEEYFYKFLGSSSIDIFIGNINSIPRKRTNHIYPNKILYTTKEYINERYNKLLGFFNTYIIPKNRITVIFGKMEKEFSSRLDNWVEYPNALGKRGKYSIKLYFGEKYKNIYWTNHPSYGWLNVQRQNKLCEIIKNKIS